MQHHAWSLVVLLQGLTTIGPTRINIGRISNNCGFEFIIELWIPKHVAHRKVDFCVDCFCEHAYFGHKFTCGESFFCHNGIHHVITQFFISFFFEFLALLSFVLDKFVVVLFFLSLQNSSKAYYYFSRFCH